MSAGDSGLDGATPAEVLQIYKETWVPQVNYLAVGSVALIVYEHLLTVVQEYRVIWTRKTSIPMVLFIINRYGLLSFGFIYLLSTFVWWPDDMSLSHSCQIIGRVQVAFIVVLDLVNVVFSSLRIHAINNRNWWWTTGIFLLGFISTPFNIAGLIMSSYGTGNPIIQGCFASVGLFGGDTDIWYRQANSTAHFPFALTNGAVGQMYARTFVFCCTVHAASLSPRSTSLVVSLGIRGCKICLDVVVLGITWYRTAGIVQAARHANVDTSVVSVLLRDGTTYFFITLAVNIGGIATLVAGLNSLSVEASILNAVTMSRFILNLRVATEHAGGTWGRTLSTLPPHLSTSASDVRFASRSNTVLGNIGASVECAGDTDLDCDDDDDEE